LTAFAGTGDAFVKTWYDQASTNDATQTATGSQPQIVSSGAVIVENGKPAVEFDGANDGYLLDTSGLDIGSLSSFTIGKYTSTGSGEMMLGLSGSTGDKRWYAPFLSSGNFAYGYADSATAITTSGDTNQNLHTMISGTTLNGVEAWLNSSSVGTATRTTGIDSTKNGIGNFDSGFYADCKIQEIIIYDSDQSSNRTNIESNINTFYSIY